MFTQDFSRDIYEEVNELSNGDLLLVIASQEFVAENKKLKLDEVDIENKILDSVRDLFERIYKEVDTGVYPKDKIYKNKDGLAVVMLSVSDAGRTNIVGYLKDRGIYTD